MRILAAYVILETVNVSQTGFMSVVEVPGSSGGVVQIKIDMDGGIDRKGKTSDEIPLTAVRLLLTRDPQLYYSYMDVWSNLARK